MTVIAWDRTSLVADGLMTHGHSIMSTRGKKIFRACDYLTDQWNLQNERVLAFGVAGDFGSASAIVDALNNMMHVHTIYPKEYAFTAILITDSGNVWLLNKDLDNDTGWLHPVEENFVAIGAGSDAAKAAMIAGKNAFDAVAIAMDCNVMCGGEIQAWEPQRTSINGKDVLTSVPAQELWVTG